MKSVISIVGLVAVFIGFTLLALGASGKFTIAYKPYVKITEQPWFIIILIGVLLFFFLIVF